MVKAFTGVAWSSVSQVKTLWFYHLVLNSELSECIQLGQFLFYEETLWSCVVAF